MTAMAPAGRSGPSPALLCVLLFSSHVTSGAPSGAGGGGANANGDDDGDDDGFNARLEEMGE